jgi:hypothetical protein
MKTYFKALLMIAAVAAPFIPSAAVAQKSAGGVVGEARMHPGTWGEQRRSRSFTRSRPMYRSTAPVIVRTERAPSAVAQAPTEERRFSYDPSQQAPARVQAGTPCPQGVVIERREAVVTEPAPATAERPTRTYRSFSYEPGIDSSERPAGRTYSRPMRRESQRPAYLLPKSDPRRYSGRL